MMSRITVGSGSSMQQWARSVVLPSVWWVKVKCSMPRARFSASGSYDGPLMQSAAMLVIGAALLLTLGRYQQFNASAAEARPG